MNQKKEADLSRVELLENLLDGDEIFEWFAHLFAMDVKVTSVPEVVYPVVAFVISLTLGDLIIVVGEAKVNTSRMDVDWVRFKDRGSHSTALNVPSRTTLTPRWWPFRFALFAFLPKRKILFTTFFARVSWRQHSFSLSKQLFWCRRSGLKLSVGMVGLFLEFLHVKINTTIRLISISIRNDLLNERHNLRYVLADTCDHLR